MSIDAGWNAYYATAVADEAWGTEVDNAWQRLRELWQPDMGSAAPLVDLGCGDGRNARPWLAAGVPVVGVDSAPRALQRLAARCRAHHLPTPGLLAADMRQVPLTPGAAGAVQCFNAVFQVAEVGSVLQEIGRILRVDGWAAFNVLTPEDGTYGEGEEIGPGTFEFKGTTFRFLSADEVQRLLPASLQIVEARHLRWWDPPHIPFRPYPHRHDSIYYFCQRRRMPTDSTT
jgi:SAM-dependent methyltransferase